MSPSWRNRIYLAIRPDGISLYRLTRGWRPKLQIEHDEALDNPTSIQALLGKLGDVLARPEWGKADVHVVVSDQMAKYALIPTGSALKNYAEKEAFARYYLAQVYGNEVEHWELRIQGMEKGAANQLVCAVDKRLLAGLRSICQEKSLRLASVTPHLMQVFNRFYTAITVEPTWLVTHEAGYSTFIRMHDHEIASVSGVRHEGIDALGMLLDRENLISEMPEPCKQVALYAPSLAGLPQNDNGYQFKKLEMAAELKIAMAPEPILLAKGRKRLNLDFQKPADVPSSFAGWALLLTGLALLVEMGISYDRLQNDRSAMDLEIQKSKLHLEDSARKAQQREYTEKDFEDAQQIMARLSAPWDGFFTGLGSINNKNVAILSVVPDMKTGILQLEGEAKDYAALLTLVEQLRTTKPFKDVFLSHHEIKQNDPQHPVSFAISMRWVAPS